MTAPIPPVTPAHAEGITATEQAAISAVEDALFAYNTAAGLHFVVRGGEGYEGIARTAVAAAAPIIAAAERARCVAVVLGEVKRHSGDSRDAIASRLALKATARKLDPVTPEQAARALEAHHAVAIARAGTSEADR